MSLTNLQRDGFHTTLKDADEIAWSAERTIVTETLQMNSSGIVNDDYFAARPEVAAVPMTVTAGKIVSIGGFIRQPMSDRSPYRVKCKAGSANGVYALGIGYAPATLIATNAVIDPVAFFPFNHDLDEVFMIDKLPDGDALEDRALAFALCCIFNNAGYFPGGISVQNLSISPPTMALATS
jgi:hypothetical protein